MSEAKQPKEDRVYKWRGWDGKRFRGQLTFDDLLNGRSLGTFRDSPENWTWQQSCGFNDKYGKEVFEGDIITFFAWPEDDKYRQVIWWGQGYSWATIDRNIPELCEVVGNIFENPDLLTPPAG